MKEKQIQKSLFKRLWTKTEDDLLKSIVSKSNNYKWAQISEEFNRQINNLQYNQTSLSRTNKQCRERWQNHLNPKLNNNGEWSIEQHKQLFDLFEIYSHQWCVIGCKLEEKGFLRRGDNNIKNYFYSGIKRASKKINEAIRANNKEVKKMKSLLYNYSEKYSYQKRMSLQRQILSLNKSPNQESISRQTQKARQNDFDFNAPSEQSNQKNFRIIKELEPKIINKIFQILQQKNSKKFTSGNINLLNINKVGSKMISYLKNYDSVTKTELIQLATQILDISRQYKRKAVKINTQRDIDQGQEENKHKNTPIEEQENAQILFQPFVEHEKCKQAELNNYKNIQPIGEDITLNKQILNEGFNLKNLTFLNNHNYSQVNVLKNVVKDQLLQKRQGNTSFFHQLFGDCPKILDQSNQYMLASNPDLQRTIVYDPFNSQIITNKNSFQNSTLHYRQLNESCNYAYPFRQNNLLKSISQEYNMRQMNNSQNYTNRCELSFIQSIKEIKPQPVNCNHDYTSQFDFANNFKPPSFKNSDQDQGIFFSQVIKKSKPSYSILSNQSQSKTNKKSNKERDRFGQIQLAEIPFQNFMPPHNLMYRSWAYSQIKPTINIGGLSNSNNFQQMHKETGIDLDCKNSNFSPYQKPINQ